MVTAPARAPNTRTTTRTTRSTPFAACATATVSGALPPSATMSPTWTTTHATEIRLRPPNSLSESARPVIGDSTAHVSAISRKIRDASQSSATVDALSGPSSTATRIGWARARVAGRRGHVQEQRERRDTGDVLFGNGAAALGEALHELGHRRQPDRGRCDPADRHGDEVGVGVAGDGAALMRHGGEGDREVDLQRDRERRRRRAPGRQGATSRRSSPRSRPAARRTGSGAGRRRGRRAAPRRSQAARTSRRGRRRE